MISCFFCFCCCSSLRVSMLLSNRKSLSLIKCNMIISHTFLQTWIVPRGISALAVLALILCKIYGLSFVELAITLKFEPRHGVPECSSSSGPTYSKWCEFFKFKVWAFWFIVHKLLFVCSLCCQCGTLIEPNPANMCVGCLRTRVDITEGIH